MAAQLRYRRWLTIEDGFYDQAKIVVNGATVWTNRASSVDPGTNGVEVDMSRLRAKADRGFAWPMLRTVKGQGHALRLQPDRISLTPERARVLPLA